MAQSAKEKDGLTNVFQSFVVEQHSPFDVDKLADRYRFRNTGWTIPEAYLALLLSAAVADGDLHQEERAEIQKLARRSRALSALSSEALAAANETVNARMQTSGDEALQEACQTLPADMCLPVFAHCVDIILSDGELLPTEARFLEKLVPMLDIDSESARRVMEVLLLKARY